MANETDGADYRRNRKTGRRDGAGAGGQGVRAAGDDASSRERRCESDRVGDRRGARARRPERRGLVEGRAEGAWGVFAVQNTWEAGVAGEEEQGKRIATLAREAGVQHFVYTSVGSAHRKTGIPHFDNKYRVEDTIRGLGFPSHVILRPVFFMENLPSPWFLNGDNLYAAMPPALKLQMIAVNDIGRHAARAFTDAEKLNRREIDLAGDAATMPEAAAALSSGLGRTITFVQIPISEVRKNSEDFALMLEWFERVGYDVDIPALARESGIRPTTLVEWARGLAEESNESKVESRRAHDESRSRAASRHHRAGVQQAIVARDESARVGAARHCRAGGVARVGRAPQHLGDRGPCGVLEVRRGTPVHRRRSRVVSTEGIELVSTSVH